MKKILLVLLLAAVFCVASAGCIAHENPPAPVTPLPTPIPDGNYSASSSDANVKNFTLLAEYWNTFCGWGLTPDELAGIGGEFTKKYADTVRDGWYYVNNTELMTELGKSAGLTETEIASFISDVEYMRVVSYHHPPVSGNEVSTRLPAIGAPEDNAK
ncbi:MAG: hypothetical protein Q4Q04_01530 [Methanocorpusculum sp.]|nr:hypothetical protein [Methanocorpusculum sp.]